MGLHKLLQKVKAQAHCDIPCGIYEPVVAKIAAKTVQRMVLQLKELQPPQSLDKEAILHYIQSVSRRVKVKEDHAEICKRELETLWSDFFKKEHLEKFPNLHETFWRAVKLCSKNKQEINEEAAEELVKAVDEIAEMFYKVKGVPERFNAYKELTDKLF